MGTKTKNEQIRRGDIYFVNLPEIGGSIQKGYRPVVVVSNNKANRHSSVISVVPITSRNKKMLPTHVPLEGHGLSSKSIIMAEQIMSIEKKNILRYVGNVSGAVALKLDDALKVQLGL